MEETNKNIRARGIKRRWRAWLEGMRNAVGARQYGFRLISLINGWLGGALALVFSVIGFYGNNVPLWFLFVFVPLIFKFVESAGAFRVAQ